MRFWTFVDRNWFWMIMPVVLIALSISDCVTGPRATASGCGVRLEIGSTPSADAGGP